MTGIIGTGCIQALYPTLLLFQRSGKTHYAGRVAGDLIAKGATATVTIDRPGKQLRSPVAHAPHFPKKAGSASCAWCSSAR